MITLQKEVTITSRKKSSDTRPVEFTPPYAQELMIIVKEVSLSTRVLDVLELFQSDINYPAFPVVDEQGRYFGIITRRNFLNFMSRAYSRELFARKGLTELLRINPLIFNAPLVIQANDRIDQIMLDFLELDPDMSFEALPVVDNDGDLAIIKIADIMLKLSESQNSLIDTMAQLSLRLKQEVASAATLQRNLLRPERIQLPGIRGLSTLITSSEVGGDFYDYYVVDERWVVMLIGDVSGHGVAAGTLVGVAKAGVHLLENDEIKYPSEILKSLNVTILHTVKQSLLMTMFAVCLDTQTGELLYANAGHQFAYVYRAATGLLNILEIGGLPLGKQEQVEYEQYVTELDVGDRLFLYTDGIVEAENIAGEYFGYERLEGLLLAHAESEPEELRDNLLASLVSHVGNSNFNDDVTIFFVEHFERQHKKTKVLDAEQQGEFELVRIVDSFYRANPTAIAPYIRRQNLVFLAESNFSDLIPNLAIQGVRRILLRNHPINNQLGWNNLLRQHLSVQDDDLVTYMHRPQHYREFNFKHSDDKSFVLDEVEAWLQDVSSIDFDRLDAVILLLDELIENGLYAAPRDGKGRQLYQKGTSRVLENGEFLRLNLSLQNNFLGLSVVDSWGTLTPRVFLYRLVRHIQGVGLDAGIGGTGLYLIWRMSDYLQVRVQPHKQTQLCAFLDLHRSFNENSDSGFQFFYHNEIYETLNE